MFKHADVGSYTPALGASSLLGLSSLVQRDQHKIHGDEAYGSHIPVVNISSMHKKTSIKFNSMDMKCPNKV